jgi:hypothetical protein
LADQSNPLHDHVIVIIVGLIDSHRLQRVGSVVVRERLVVSGEEDLGKDQGLFWRVDSAAHFF